MRRLSYLFAPGLALLLSATGCIVKTETSKTESDEPEIKVERKAPDRDISPGEEGAFEKIGARMDRGAEKLDKGIEKGAGKLGEAMQKAGERMQERSEEAQRRRAEQEAAEGTSTDTGRDIDVNIHVDRP